MRLAALGGVGFLSAVLGCGDLGVPATTPPPNAGGSPGASQTTSQALLEQRAGARAQLAEGLGPLLRRDASRVTVERDARGRTLIDLRGGFGHALVVRRGPDGQLQRGCVDNLQQAEQFFDVGTQTEGGTVAR